jgi:hypothetical protein
MDDPILMEATMVKCSRDRSRTKYEIECVNAREAVNRLANGQEEERQQELDRQSERKRVALRQAQLAATQARQRTAERQRLRQEAEYFGQFEATAGEGVAEQGVSAVSVAEETAIAVGELSGNEPGAVIPQADNEADADSPRNADYAGSATEIVLPPPAAQPGSDLEAVREQLKQRQEPPSDD